MGFDLTGKVVEKFDTVQVTDSFRKREFIVEYTDSSSNKDFFELIKFQLTQDKCDIADQIEIGDEIKVYFNIKGRKWEKDGKVNYFTNLDAWRIEKMSFDSELPPPPDDSDFAVFDGDDEDLPF